MAMGYPGSKQLGRRSKRVTVRMSPVLHAELTRHAEDLGLGVAQLIRKILGGWVRQTNRTEEQQVD
jgi:predicted HicB family RNase H-like nuclease